VPATTDAVDPVDPVAASEVRRWDHAADVVVVGLGCAGACAAIAAAEAGADVLVVEAAPSGGGTSAMSGGIVYLGGGTPVQQACGFEDTPENMARFLRAACGPGVDDAKLTAFCEGSVEHFGWLVDHGVPFEARYHPEHDREPPDTSGLVYSGGEDSWPYSELAVPAPRGHHPAFPDAAGGFLMQRLLDAVSARVVTDAVVARLVVDDGAVVGLQSSAGSVRARRGVVLAAGGFTFNPAMVEQHCPAVLRCSVPIGTPFDDGRAIRMAVGAGARVVGMANIEVGMPLTPPRSVVRGIIVDGEGRRFVNEDTYAGRVASEIVLRQGGRAYWVHDDNTFAVNVAGYKPSWVAESTAELESMIGLPPASLARTLARYNASAVSGSDPEFHKAAEWVVPLEPPYGVVDLGVERSYYAAFTLGGLATTPAGEVVGVPGLFAAGRTTAGIAAGGYVSGMSLGDGTFFGRAAGASAASFASA
jgi:3-oxo-5alpha-steroid 4-dehydrogenase